MGVTMTKNYELKTAANDGVDGSFVAEVIKAYSDWDYSDRALASAAILYRETVGKDFVGDFVDVENVGLMLDNLTLERSNFAA